LKQCLRPQTEVQDPVSFCLLWDFFWRKRSLKDIPWTWQSVFTELSAELSKASQSADNALVDGKGLSEGMVDSGSQPVLL
jgi:hypothetical protein